MIEIERVFDASILQFAFPLDTNREDRDAWRHDALEAAKQLVDKVLLPTGYRFWSQRSSYNKPGSASFQYRCCQDVQNNPTIMSQDRNKHNRDYVIMERYNCHSSLNIFFSANDRTVTFKFAHSKHDRYTNNQLSENIIEFIGNRVLGRSPSDIFDEIKDAKVPGYEKMSERQVYYRWSLANSKRWRHHEDPIVSSSVLLNEEETVSHQFLCANNVRGISIIINNIIERISHFKEISMDETFGTNNAGMGLFAVLVEVDGAGIPVAYLLYEVAPNAKGEKKAETGAMVYLLQQFLGSLKAIGFNPTFVGHDKDAAEMAAIRIVWEKAHQRLCYWHAKRAILTKMRDSDRTLTQRHYYPAEAQQFVPDLEICWGSDQLRRPDGEHRRGNCNCASKHKTFEPNGRLETRDKKERDVVAEIFSRHLNVHTAFPDINGIYKDKDTIYRDSVREIYTWCRAKNYFRLFAYLWVNWYRPNQWATWARAAAPEIPVLKTTMVVESHWKTVKHDYLHKFHRPRIDLVVWVILTKVVRDTARRLNRIVTQDSRDAGASWRKKFKATWKKLANAEVDPANIGRYHTNPFKFVCACPAFLQSRFLICKHLVHCFENIPIGMEMGRFYYSVSRHTTAPFWRSPQLRIRGEYLHLASSQSEGTYPELDTAESASDVECLGDGTDMGYLDSEEGMDEDLDEQLTERREKARKFAEQITAATELFLGQLAADNLEFTDRFMAFNSRMSVSGEEFLNLRRRRIMPTYWGSGYKNPATRFMK